MDSELQLILSTNGAIAFLLVLSRVSGMLASAPMFSTFPIPAQAKAILALFVTFIMYPLVVHSSTYQPPTDMIMLTIMVFKELFVGLLIGFCANLIFYAVQMAGQLLSIQMGLTMSTILDPVTQQQAPVVGQFYMFIACMVFIQLNAHQWLFSSIYNSYKTIPIGLDFTFNSTIVPKIIYFTSQLFPIAFGIIMPIFILMFLIDVALGFTSKMMPQMNIYMVAMPLKAYLGITLMLLFITTTTVYLGNLISNTLENLKVIFS